MDELRRRMIERKLQEIVKRAKQAAIVKANIDANGGSGAIYTRIDAMTIRRRRTA